MTLLKDEALQWQSSRHFNSIYFPGIYSNFLFPLVTSSIYIYNDCSLRQRIGKANKVLGRYNRKSLQVLLFKSKKELNFLKFCLNIFHWYVSDKNKDLNTFGEHRLC